MSTHTQEEVRSDEELIRACQRGDQQAWHDTVTYLYPQLMRFARNMVRGSNSPHQNAEDLVSDALVRLHKSMNRLTPDSTLLAWMITVMRRLATDNYRAHTVRVQEQFSYDGDGTLLFDGPSGEIEADPEGFCVARSSLREAFRRLSPEQRQVLTAVYGRGLTFAQIAAELGVPVGTVKSRSHYAIRCLREELNDSQELTLAA